MNRWIRLATKIATTSRHHQHKMACVVVRGGAVLSAEANDGPGRGHAEERAIRPHRDYAGATAYVVRLNGRHISRPCPSCAAILQEAGIDRVVFVDVDETLRCVDADELMAA